MGYNIVFCLVLLCLVEAMAIKSQLSLARSNLAATTVKLQGGRELGLFGGGNSGTTQNIDTTVDIFDELGNLVNTTDLSKARYWLTATSIGDLAFFAGGAYSTPLNIVDIFNATSNSWTTSTLSESRFLLASASAKGIAVFAGGANTSTTVSDRVDIFNSTSGKWSISHLSQPRNVLAGTSVGELILFGGGGATDGLSDRVDIYNAITGVWSTARLSQARSNLVATSVGKFALFAGGDLPTGSSNIVDIFDSVSGEWSVATLSQNRSYLAATSVGELALFGCGAIGTYLYDDVLDIFDSASRSWSTATMSQPRGSYTATTVGKLALFGGGYTHIGDNYGPSAAVDGFAYCDNRTVSYTVADCNPIPSPSPTPPSRPSSTWIYILAGCLGGALLLAIIVIAIVVGRNKRRRERYVEIPSVTPIRRIKGVAIMERLGGGQFGEVYRGIIQNTTSVALKKLISSTYLDEFDREASVLCGLNHPNIVRFYGVYIAPNQENYIVTEYLSEGSLNRVLQEKKEEITLSDLLNMCKHVIAGMCYLEENNIVHRDLALRNLLVTLDGKGKYVVKVGDFGMSRSVNKGYYKTADKTMPVKWSAPEFIEYGTCTSKSDVWSFGVCLWEMFSYGRLPYPGMSNDQVVEKVVAGYKMDSPPECPIEVYNIMLSCWEREPHQRPNFEGLAIMIDQCVRKYCRPETQVAEPSSLNVSNNIEYTIYN